MNCFFSFVLKFLLLGCTAYPGPFPEPAFLLPKPDPRMVVTGAPRPEGGRALSRRKKDGTEMPCTCRTARNRKRWIVVLLSVLAAVLAGGIGCTLLLRRRLLRGIRQWEAAAADAERRLRQSDRRNRTLLMAEEEAVRRQVLGFRRQWTVLTDLCGAYHASYGDPEARNIIYNKVMDLTSAIGSDDKSYRKLERCINEALYGAMEHFRTDFGGRLTEEQIRMAAYLMAGFDASLIADLLRLKDVQTVYRNKNRLLNKIRLSSSPNKKLYMSVLS